MSCLEKNEVCVFECSEKTKNITQPENLAIHSAMFKRIAYRSECKSALVSGDFLSRKKISMCFSIFWTKHYPALESGHSQCDFEQKHATRAGLNPDCRGDWAAWSMRRQFAGEWAVAWEEGKGGGYLLELKKIRSESLGLHAWGQRPRRITFVLEDTEVSKLCGTIWLCEFLGLQGCIS